LESSIQGTNTSTAGTDERLVDIEQKQLHARIVLRVHVIFYRGGQKDCQFTMFHRQFQAAVRLQTYEPMNQCGVRHLIFVFACGTDHRTSCSDKSTSIAIYRFAAAIPNNRLAKQAICFMLDGLCLISPWNSSRHFRIDPALWSR
jgi:hypothetical protein